MQPVISVAATGGLLPSITAAHGNIDEILEAAGANRQVFSDPEGFIPTSLFSSVLEQAAHRTGDHLFGLHFGERYNPKLLGPLTYVVLNSPTIAAAIENAERYLTIHNRAAQLSLRREERGALLEDKLMSTISDDARRQQQECSMTVLLNILKMMMGIQWTPSSSSLEYSAARSCCIPGA